MDNVRGGPADLRVVRSPGSPSIRSLMWPSDPTLDLGFDEWLGLIDRGDTAPRARLEPLSGPHGTFFVLGPDQFLRSDPFCSSTSPSADTWPIDPTVELSDDEWLGLDDRIDRTPRGRMELCLGPEGTVAVVTGWSSYPVMATRLPPSGAPLSSAPTSQESSRTRREQTSAERARSRAALPSLRALVQPGGDIADGEEFLSTVEAAKYLGYAGDSSLRRAKALGHITPDAIGPRRVSLYRRATLDDFLRRLRVAGVAGEGAGALPLVAASVDVASVAEAPTNQTPEVPHERTRELSGPTSISAVVRPPEVAPRVLPIVAGSAESLFDRPSPRRRASFVADLARILSLVGRDNARFELITAYAQASSASRRGVGVPPCASPTCRASTRNGAQASVALMHTELRRESGLLEARGDAGFLTASATS